MDADTLSPRSCGWRASPGRMTDVVLTRAGQREAADLVQRLLDLVDDGKLAADGPAAVALVRRLEGAMMALVALTHRDALPHS